MSRRLRAALIAGGAAAMICFVWSGRPWPAPYLPFFISTAVIGLSFLVAGIAAWQRWPANRLGLLFTIVGYAYLLPATLSNLSNPLAFTIGNLTATVSGAALVHLALAWPSGRLRSRFERWVVIAEYTWTLVPTFVSMLFWNPSFCGCSSGCHANLLLIDSSRSVWSAVNVASVPGSIALTGIVLALIVRHWRSARGWSRRVMMPLLWISCRGRRLFPGAGRDEQSEPGHL